MAWYKPWSWGSGDAGSQPSDLVEQIREMAHDLVTLEINTIIKSNMTAERMPTVPNALLDIARDYMKAFEALRADLTPIFATDGPEEWPSRRVILVEDEGFVGYPPLPDPVLFGKLFECLRWGAKNTRHEFAAQKRPLSDSDRTLLERIDSNCDTLRTLLDRYPALREGKVSQADIRADRDVYKPAPRLSARDLLIVKKVWEINVEEVVMQTSVQLDGDIVSRISQEIAADKERMAQILAIHQQGVETGLGNWRALADAVVAVVRGMVGGPGAAR